MFGKRCAFALAQKHHAVAPLLERLGPGQPLDAELGEAFGKKPRGLLAGRDRQRLLGKRDGAKPPALAATQRQANRIENNFVAQGDAVGKVCINLGERDLKTNGQVAYGGAPVVEAMKH